MTWRHVFASGLACVVLSQHAPGQTGQTRSRVDEVAGVLRASVANGTVGSAVGLVARGDQILLLAAAGQIEPGEEMPVNAIARLASIQKPITAAAVLMLYERGQLDLDDSVAKWFPDFGERVLTEDGDTLAAVRRPTVFELLTHQAGLVARGPELDALWDARTTGEFARRIGRIPLRFQPGTRYEYGCCGSAYEVLAAIVERVSGQSFKDFLQENILDPLGMKDTYFFVPEPKLHRLAAHYGRNRAGDLVVRVARGDEPAEKAFYSGGGGLRSTVRDYYRFQRMLLNSGELDGVRVLKPETVGRMTSNQVGSKYPVPGFGWGFGVRVQTDAAAGPAGKGAFGWNGGTGTRFVVDPSTGLIAIIFVPSWPGTAGVDELRAEFITKAVAVLADPEAVPRASAGQDGVTLVGEGVISTPFDDLNAAFTPGQDTVYFTRMLPDDRTGVILSSHRSGGTWSTPTLAPFSGSFSDVDPFITPDGSRLFFSSNRPLSDSEPATSYDIWMVERVAGGWSEPVNLGPPVNTGAQEYYPTLTAGGTLYFSSTRPGGGGSGDIFRARPEGDGYAEPENLGEAVNSDRFDGDPFIAPDESFLVFTSYGRPDDLGNRGGRPGDLYVSRNRNGVWSPARHLDPPINSEAWDYCPIVSPDGRRLYFSSYRGLGNVLPVRLRSYGDLQHAADQTLNGLGNVFWISVQGLGLDGQ